MAEYLRMVEEYWILHDEEQKLHNARTAWQTAALINIWLPEEEKISPRDLLKKAPKRAQKTAMTERDAQSIIERLERRNADAAKAKP